MFRRREYIREPASIHRSSGTGLMFWSEWSPAQFVALTLGIGMAVMGGIALSRVPDAGVLQSHTTVWDMHFTTLLAYIAIGWGAAMALAGMMASAGRSLMILLGAAALGFGAVVWGAHSNMHENFGVHRLNGITYVIIGGVAMVAGMLSPVISGAGYRTRGEQVAEEHEAEIHRHDRAA